MLSKTQDLSHTEALNAVQDLKPISSDVNGIGALHTLNPSVKISKLLAEICQREGQANLRS